jgi:dTDP-4-amino-4,6-dideoxygalactose transaminase
LKPIPFLSLAPQHSKIQTEVLNAITNVYERNWFVLGSELETFEKEFAHFSNTSHCIGVGNGLDALFIALRACDIGLGDDVIVPAHTFLATWLAVSRTGAQIIPVDADLLTFNIDVQRVDAAITNKTKAIIPVHLYGLPCDMTALSTISRSRGINIIEDNAQAHGATWNGKITGSFGDISATSFYPVKNMGALGDAGAIVTRNDDFAQFARRYRNYGFEVKNVAGNQGVNSRLDEIQAAVLNVKLKYLQTWNDDRIQLAAIYLTNLEGIGDIQLPFKRAEAKHVYHLFVIRTSKRDALREHLAAHHIETAIHYPIPPHLQKSYRVLGYKKGDYPVAEDIANTVLSLPLWPGMEKSQVERVCEVVRKFFE